MTKEERCRKALACHATTLNCAQSVLCAFSDRLGWSDDQCAALGSGFGGGVRYGGVCGTVSAAVMILGLLYPHTPENGMDGKRRATRLTKEFESRFTAQFGKLDCRDLLAIGDLQGTEMTEKLNVDAHCDKLIVSAVELLSDMLDELEKE
jgi:C_GCAxxG_C_C family probable redox protein